jgi:hypothetical protein
MSKTVTPKQLELTAGKTREELLLAKAGIDPENPAFKESLKKIEKIELAEAATAVLAQAGPPRPEVEFEDFDWHTDPSVVLKSQPATAIYYNPAGSYRHSAGAILGRRERPVCVYHA